MKICVHQSRAIDCCFSYIVIAKCILLVKKHTMLFLIRDCF